MCAMRGIHEEPKGLLYLPDFIGIKAEKTLLNLFDDLDFDQVVLRGQASRRLVRHFGLAYNYTTRKNEAGEPLPPPLDRLRQKTEQVVGLAVGSIAQTIVTKYPVGSTINWHKDSPVFEEIVGVSLGSAVMLRMRKGEGEDRRVFEQEIEPRSAYVLQGEARSEWQHHISAHPEERYSVTFRTLSGDQPTPHPDVVPDA